MDRPLAIGGVSSVATSLLWTVLHSVHQDFEGHQFPLNLPTINCDCSGLQFEDINPWVFGIGVLTGLAAGPIIDLLYLLRQRWRRWIWRTVAAESGPPRALYKVLA